jgi:hypothetical protein
MPAAPNRNRPAIDTARAGPFRYATPDDSTGRCDMTRSPAPSVGRLLFILLLLSPLAQATAGKVDRAEIRPGDRVRIEYRDDVRKRFLFLVPYTQKENLQVTGELVTITDEQVTVRPDAGGTVRGFALDGVRKVSVARGTRRHLIGGLVGGFFLGSFLAYTTVARTPEMDTDELNDADRAFAITIWGAVTAIGGVLGYLNVSERWREVSRDARPPTPAPSVTVDGRALRLRVAFRF